MVTRALLLASLAAAACTANDDIPAPQLGAVTPDQAVPGTVVQLSGAYFCQRPDTGQEDPSCQAPGEVTFGTTPASTVTWADNAIAVEVPAANTGEADVTVAVAGRTSNSIAFTIE